MVFVVKKDGLPTLIKSNTIFKIFVDFWSNTLGNFWNLAQDPYGKTITNFNVKYISGSGQVDVNWGEGINESVTSGTNINHTFGITKSGISIFSSSGANITDISCGASSPKLGGAISLSAFSSLTGFVCTGNGITAFSGIESCPNLINLELGVNSLTKFPSFNHTPLLNDLKLENNLLSGSIPSLDNLTNLKNLRFQENKNITGNLPSLSLLPNLESFYAIGCNLRGPIPNLSQNTLLKDFRIDSQTTSPKINGTIPSLSGNTQLAFFLCQNNQLSGSIPSLSGNTLLRNFSCHTNQLTGSIPSLSGLSNLQIFQCQTNQLTGFIPILSGLIGLQDFRCHTNQLTGSIPSFSGLSNLQVFTCQTNKLTGFIPILSGSTGLRTFTCQTNQLGGSIPILSRLRDLQEFQCNANQLTGFIPSLTGLSNLQIFQCHTNQITGSIPSLTGLSNLQIFQCQINRLTGFIPSLSGLIRLQDLRCQTNQLTGSIPSLNGLSALQLFRCQENKLTGFGGGIISRTLGDFQAQNNSLTASVVNNILAAFVVANRTTGTRILNLGGSGNAAPTSQGIIDKALLTGRGWTVTTN
jgi:Leucine-rich repeat (LRR) protein